MASLTFTENTKITGNIATDLKNEVVEDIEEYIRPYREPSPPGEVGITSYSSQSKESPNLEFSRVNAKSIVKVLPRYEFTLKQKWVGYVISVSDDAFLARLITMVGEGTEIEAEIYLEEVAERDHPLIQPGATFYWSIGYNDTSGRQRVSEIRFRRLPPWTREELEIANAEAASIRALFDDK